MDLTKQVVNQYTYSKNILNLINDFITIPEYQVNNNKKKVMDELNKFCKWWGQLKIPFYHPELLEAFYDPTPCAMCLGCYKCGKCICSYIYGTGNLQPGCTCDEPININGHPYNWD